MKDARSVAVPPSTQLDYLPSTRLDSLTGARFVAALAVFVYHAHMMYKADGLFGHTLAVIGRTGSIGVDFFFVLSGFVLMWSWRKGDSTRAYLRRRFARIAPAYWVAFAGGLLWVLSYSPQPAAVVIRAVPAALALQAWFPDNDVHFAANGVEWSVSAELFFYLLFPALILLLSRRTWTWALIVAAVLCGFVLPEAASHVLHGDLAIWFVNICPAMKIGEFMCGLLLAAHLRRGKRSPIGLGTASIALLICYLGWPIAPSWVPGRALVLLAILALVGALAQRDIDGRGSWLAGRAPVRLGVWSYCFYLVHQVTLGISATMTHRTLSGQAYGPVWLIVSLLASIALAALLYSFIERPAERRLRGGRRAPFTRRLVVPTTA